MSYTTFKIGQPILSSKTFDGNGTITVTVPVTNIGDREGSEVVQLYVRDEKSSVYRPYKELKAFGKVNLAPGETHDVKLTLNRDAFAYYDAADKMWTVEPGKFELLMDSGVHDDRLPVSQKKRWPVQVGVFFCKSAEDLLILRYEEFCIKDSCHDGLFSDLDAYGVREK